MTSERFHYERKELTNEIVLWQLYGAPEISDWNSFLTDATLWLREHESRGRNWSVIVDPSQMTQVSAAARRAAGEWRRHHIPLIANVCTRACYVADSPMIRGAITAVLWFAQPVVEVVVRANQADAQKWLEERSCRNENAPPSLEPESSGVRSSY